MIRLEIKSIGYMPIVYQLNVNINLILSQHFRCFPVTLCLLTIIPKVAQFHGSLPNRFSMQKHRKRMQTPEMKLMRYSLQR